MLLRSGMVRARSDGARQSGGRGKEDRVCAQAVRVRGDAKRSDLLGDRRGGWCGELAPVRDTRAWRSRVGQGPTAEKPLHMLKFTGRYFCQFSMSVFFVPPFSPFQGRAQPLVARSPVPE